MRAKAPLSLSAIRARRARGCFRRNFRRRSGQDAAIHGVRLSRSSPRRPRSSRTCSAFRTSIRCSATSSPSSTIYSRGTWAELRFTGTGVPALRSSMQPGAIEYFACVEEEKDGPNHPAAAYINGSTALYEQVARRSGCLQPDAGLSAQFTPLRQHSRGLHSRYQSTYRSTFHKRVSRLKRSKGCVCDAAPR